MALFVASTTGACVIPLDDSVGRACQVDGDCPADYHCVARLPGGGLTCEVIYPLALAADGGGAADAGPDAGPTYFYCSDAKPILDTFCAPCHGPSDIAGQGFRLDYYDPPDAGMPLGAFFMADRIKVRAYDFQNMPPFGNPTPSDSQRLTLALWDLAGAPFCDGGLDGGG